MNRIKKWVAMVLAASFVFLLAGCCGPQTPADKGYIERDGEYYVYNADGLAAWIEATKTAPDTDCLLLDNITIPADMELDQVGVYKVDNEQYEGTFNGNGKTIRGLTKPIFVHIGENGVVTNLNLEVNINLTSFPGTSYNFIGGLVENNAGRIENCTVTGSVSTNTTYTPCQVGGIAGYNTMSGTIYNCRSEANVTATSPNSDGIVNVGGIVGRNDGTVRGCVASGNISGSATTKNLGGIAGADYGTVKSCTNKTNIPDE